MQRLFRTRPRLVFAATAVAGTSCTAAAALYLRIRDCRFEPFGPETDRVFFAHSLFKQTNPFNKPMSADSCVREVPFERLDQELLEDARAGGTKLIERFSQGLWGGSGYAIQRRIMEFTKNDENKEDVWSKEDLLACKYSPGTYLTNHFLVLSKTPTSIMLRGCFDPHHSTPRPVNVDNLIDLQAYIDQEKRAAVFKLRAATFDGTEEASEKEDPFGGVGGWLHRQYSSLLVESGAQNCMM
ncbi:hypothetical protein BU24DRAFT_379872 [Aaosphaeria arxii CBS 175.79]|uniref:Uncharacterized protein n=1 Tax=Aaosphaeria arxii CBS 175.79 TaxID=1450172 RepID=A0A6A5X9L1_9PLEO|nr:uncharacterized protein BU24DRAFT_379872 [Aaosphaeria arxii CBS 175.79]KAF2009457.1 hypothetical protein BU24DRAFT_379872 [Aaosphaeria arxii CBS 175.79]